MRSQLGMSEGEGTLFARVLKMAVVSGRLQWQLKKGDGEGELAVVLGPVQWQLEMGDGVVK